MLTNLLNNLPEGGKMVGIGEAALYALIGFAVVFAGIAFLIFVVWWVGALMNEFNVKEKKGSILVATEETPTLQEINETPIATSETEEVDEETVAVIMAALMAYYEQNNPKCEFTLKRIKRIRRDDYA